MKIYRLGIHEKKFNLIEKPKINIYAKKEELIKIKCKIDEYNNKEWEDTKKKFNPYEYIYTSSKQNQNICGIVPVSRSYFKLHEIIKDIPLIEQNTYCACIAEGPGGFIHCLNDYSTKYNNRFFKIFGITLISNDKSIPYWNQQITNNPNNRILSGEDGTGDLYQFKNSQHFIKSINMNYCHFITADGGFDYSKDYNLQEESSYRLLYCEIYIALHIQKLNGNFVLKVFDLFNYQTIQLIYLLYNHYSIIEFHKPLTSRSSNSEKYIVCSQFKGCPPSTKETLKEYYEKCCDFYIDVPQSFINEINKYNDLFVNNQIKTIHEILENIGEKKRYPSKQQIGNAKRWCELYDLPINENCIYT